MSVQIGTRGVRHVRLSGRRCPLKLHGQFLLKGRGSPFKIGMETKPCCRQLARQNWHAFVHLGDTRATAQSGQQDEAGQRVPQVECVGTSTAFCPPRAQNNAVATMG